MFLETDFYSDEKFENLVEERKSSPWESGDEGAFTKLDSFLETIVRAKI